MTRSHDARLRALEGKGRACARCGTEPKAPANTAALGFANWPRCEVCGAAAAIVDVILGVRGLGRFPRWNAKGAAQ